MVQMAPSAKVAIVHPIGISLSLPCMTQIGLHGEKQVCTSHATLIF